MSNNIDWDDLQGNTFVALKSACKKYGVAINGKATKMMLIQKLEEYKSQNPSTNEKVEEVRQETVLHELPPIPVPLCNAIEPSPTKTVSETIEIVERPVSPPITARIQIDKVNMVQEVTPKMPRLPVSNSTVFTISFFMIILIIFLFYKHF